MREASTESDTMVIQGEHDSAKRAEILFLYDTRMSNPNGDPEANEPRYFDETQRLYVTEFRLKRTIRKYLNEVKIPKMKILLRQEVDEELEKKEGIQSFKMLDKLATQYIDKDGNGKRGNIPKIDSAKLLADHIDIRAFGILFAVGKLNFKQIGPIQFGMAQSLNTLKRDSDIIRVTMTSLVPNTAKEGISKGGSFGEKWIVRYALMQHHGFVNNNVAKDVNLTETDVKTILDAMWNGTDNLVTTSKFGQKSRLLIKVNYKANGYLGDLDLMTKLEYEDQNKTLENITELTLNLDKLLDLLKENKSIIDSIDYQYNKTLTCRYYDNTGTFDNIVKKWSKDSGIPGNLLGNGGAGK